MKQIIDGKIYNTETAQYIGFHAEGGCRDFRAFEESLYKTPRGRYFLAGSGGPMTRYAVKCDDGNSWTGGEKITAISEEEARRWCERYMDADEYLKYFDAEEA